MSHALRLQLAELQGWTCPICGGAIQRARGREPALFTTLDHVWPRRGKSGSTGLYRNALATHADCNSAKGDRPPTGCEIIWLTAVNARMALEAPKRAVRVPTLADLWPA